MVMPFKFVILKDKNMEPILPEPTHENSALKGVNSESTSGVTERQLDVAAETPSAGPSSQSNPALDDAVAAVNMALPAAPQGTVPANDDGQLLADDVDVIEKEWVEKAKKIVHETREDPYMQEKEVSKLQSDYLQKRYGKQLKVTE